ncbi:hypothetical protein B7P43_G17535 [Cryptotermes secundus]|uniref:Uncharacterized protein n=1 Tax=Cryptotermes secundus TaxID=105785 RepID=A0A2J7Q0B2_9NEOP|nr:hypothetical protein B7P43_G17535 [Cryptotermes secundus]
MTRSGPILTPSCSFFVICFSTLFLPGPVCLYLSQVMAVILPYTYITEFYFSTMPELSTLACQNIEELAAKKFLTVPIRKMP